jgi:hypothetical protein
MYLKLKLCNVQLKHLTKWKFETLLCNGMEHFFVLPWKYLSQFFVYLGISMSIM